MLHTYNGSFHPVCMLVFFHRASCQSLETATSSLHERTTRARAPTFTDDFGSRCTRAVDSARLHHRWYKKCIKQLRDGSSSMGCMTCLYTCLYDRFEALRDEHLSVGCTCPYKSRIAEKNGCAKIANHGYKDGR